MSEAECFHLIAFDDDDDGDGGKDGECDNYDNESWMSLMYCTCICI